MTFMRLTRRNLAALKHSLLEAFPDIGSAHADEALAAGIGFNTHAALLATLKAQGEGARLAIIVDETAVVERLQALEAFAADSRAVAVAFSKARLPDGEGRPWAELARLRKAANEN